MSNAWRLGGVGEGAGNMATVDKKDSQVRC